MIIALIASLVANILLGLAIASLWKRYEAGETAAHQVAKYEKSLVLIRAQERDAMFAAYAGLAKGVAKGLSEIRQDINANYAHIHDGSVLDSVIWQLDRTINDARGGAPCVYLSESLSTDVRKLGGDVGADGTMDLGQLVAFGWIVHAAARERADSLRAVVSEPCGHPDHVSWLTKTLAIYERMCSRDKDIAIGQLRAVLDAWGQEDTYAAARHLELT